jgi:hypothetical protein
MDLWSLSDLSTPWCLHVVSTLDIAGHINAGVHDIGQLAAAAGADADALARVLRHLVSKGVFTEPAPGRFELNEMAQGLLDPGLRLGLNLDSLGGRMAYAWGTLLKAVRTGRPAYSDIFGRPYWEDLEAHPEIAATFDLLMGPGHGVPDPEVLLNPADWSSVNSVVDVGGGTGALLAEVLRAHPELHGTLVDLPRTVARSGGVFQAAGVADRVTVSGQSFFDPLPAGAHLYLLKNVLADWPDPEARSLLIRCAEAARPAGGRVVLVGGVNPGETASPELLMLILVGGNARTLSAFRKLAQESGLEVVAFGRQASGRFLVECRPV